MCSRFRPAILLGAVLANAAGATVLHEDSQRFHGMDAWIAMVAIGGGGVIASYGRQTGVPDRIDSLRELVVYQRDENVFALMCQVNVMDFFGENRLYDRDYRDAFLEELSEFYSTMEFRNS